MPVTVQQRTGFVVHGIIKGILCSLMDVQAGVALECSHTHTHTRTQHNSSVARAFQTRLGAGHPELF